MKALLSLVNFLVFGLALIHGLVAAIRWWQGDSLEFWEYCLLVVWPVLVYLFIVRYSIFKKDCTACRKE